MTSHTTYFYPLRSVFRNASLSHHHCFPKALVEDTRVLNSLPMVVGIYWQDFYVIKWRNCIENMDSCYYGLGKIVVVGGDGVSEYGL